MGACGPWSVDVSAFVVFDNGKRATTQPQLITSGDYNSYAPSSLKDEQLKTALKHEDSTIRAQAIEALMQSNWDRETIKLVLQAKFEDSNTEVRTTAAKVAARMGFKALAAKIASLLIAARSTLEVSIYSYALGTLKDPGTIDALVLRFIDFKSGTRELAHLTLEGTYTPQKALLEIQHPDVPVKLRPLLIKYKEWASPSATEEDVSRYIELCKMLVAYRDVASAPMLLEALIKSPRERILSAIIFDLYSLDDVIVQDPFILAMRPAFETTLKRQNWNDRMIALKMLCLMSSDRTYVENILRGGLKDEVGKVRRWAAELAARFKYRSLAPEIINLYKSSTEETDKIVYCSALESMGIDCQ
jgi:HEAT repeat protein